jgi:predicted MPP superfamily phosphohydrolase
MGGFGVNEARKPPRVYHTKIPIPGLPDHLAGFKIAQISDVHVGLLIDGKYLAEVVRRVNELKPDIIAVTGDLMDGSVAQLRQETACLMDLVAARGKYFVTGNHEYYSGVEEWLDEIDRLGIKTLMNTNEVIRYSSLKKGGAGDGDRNLVIAGVPDHREGKNAGHLYDPAGALKGAQAGDIKILLAHQPVAVPQSLEAGYHLQISGHTHGGQFFPYNMFVPLVYPYNAGLYNHAGPNNDHMWVYVNRGTGYWGPPLRIGVPSEITLLTLEKAAAIS